MWIRLALLFSMAVAVQAQDDPKDLLGRVSQKVMDTVNRLPKYVCTLTIDRDEYHVRTSSMSTCDNLAAEKKAGRVKRTISASDRLRLDVAIGTSHEVFGTTNEMYSWVGDNRFDNHGLFNLVRQGALSSGSFSALLSSIFGEDRASFSYDGDLMVDGRLVAEFAFRIPLEKSNYLYLYGRDRSEHVRTAAEGTFLADARTFDLVRLTVRHLLPPEADACETAQTLDYGRVSLGGGDFLLATEGRLNILSSTDEMENHMVYSACHEFHGESTLSFDSPEDSDGSGPKKSDGAIRAFALPPSLPFKLAFTTGIDTAVVAAGDPIRAKLTTPIRDRSAVLVPAGAIVLGRVTKAEHLYEKDKAFLLAVRLESVVVGGISRPLPAAQDSGARRFAKSGRLTQRFDLGLLVSGQDRDIGIFEFEGAGPNYVIKSGFESKWLTVGP